ncbi:MAG: sigma-54-dependent transcriptional regulator [Pirellulaceae bacterium]
MNADATRGTGADRTGWILVVDDHAAARESMAEILSCAGHRVSCCASAAEALNETQHHDFDVIITDLRMPGMNGLEFVRILEQRRCDAQIVMVTAHGSVAAAVDAMRHGVFDFVEKPFTVDRLEDLVARALRHGELVPRRSTVPASMGHDDAMVGSSAPMRRLRQTIAQVAPTSETVLILGESGVGKELVARAIHAASRRSAGALVSLNCPALSPQLMESELFGHERGAFTSADAPRVGRFELADQGTILLDEVTEISLPLQAKLLRVLQTKTFERVGSSETRSVDVRVLASSNRDLRREVAAGNFREDLFFRLAVVPLQVPPLRERREDVPQLADQFLQQVAQRLEQPPCRLDAGAADLLMHYHWPGNVRELENLITRATVLRTSASITADQLRPWLIAPEEPESEGDDPVMPVPRVGMKLDEMERRLIEATLDQYQGHRAQTAKALGIGIRTLTNKLRAYGYAPRARAFARAS